MTSIKLQYPKTSAARFKLCIAACISIVMIIELLSGSLMVSAATLTGSGTAKDPYIVTTAQQLDAIRNNLKANYKLGNTIDMSGFGEFAPIGNLANPFAGIFTCDTNADGTPKYAIKNLKVYNHAGEKYNHQFEKNNYLDYVSKSSKWEAGLFGATQGANIKNIALLSVNVTNTVIGQNNQNKDFSRNPGQGEMGTGALIGISTDSEILNCMSSGSITSKSNNTGGLIGSLTGGELSFSYSQTTVTNAGYWGTGGLIGGCNGTVNYCFATGNVSGGATEQTTGGLIGNMTEGTTYLVSNCYSTGKILTSGYSIFGFRQGYGNFSPTWAVSCYTTSSVTGYTPEAVATATNDNYMLSTAGGHQPEFATKTAAELKSAFSSLGDWDTSGEFPKLKKLSIIQNESSYSPDKNLVVAATSQTNSQAVTGTVSTSSEPSGESDISNESEQVETLSTDEIIQMIEALPIADDITLDNKDAVKKAKKGYDALDVDSKLTIPQEKVVKLMEVYNTIVPLISKNIVDRVKALPDTNKLKDKNYNQVMEIYDDYNFISDLARESMNQDIVDKLLSAVEAVKPFADQAEQASTGNWSTSERILVIMLSTLNVLVLSIVVVSTLYIVRKTRMIKSPKEEIL